MDYIQKFLDEWWESEDPLVPAIKKSKTECVGDLLLAILVFVIIIGIIVVAILGFIYLAKYLCIHILHL